MKKKQVIGLLIVIFCFMVLIGGTMIELGVFALYIWLGALAFSALLGAGIKMLVNQ